MDIVIELEAQRMHKNIATKQVLCKLAGIRPEMYSYMLRRAKQGHPLPADCLSKVRAALDAHTG